MGKINHFCSGENPNVFLKTDIFGKICKYQKRAGQTYETNEIIKDFCFEAFFIAYPYCLALLYNAKFPNKDEVKLSCPERKGIIFTAKRYRCRNLLMFYFLKFLKWLSEKLSYPLDIEDWHVKLEVIENKGACPKGYKLGKTYEFNIGKLDELCPASFYQLYPLFFSIKKSLEVNCPDHEGMSYLIKKGDNI